MIYELGRHRLMCGDSGNPEHVARLFDGVKPDLVFTSPPYAQQRRYVSGIGDWDVLMQRVFGALPHHEKTQVLVNLGLVHRNGEWVPYWDGWIEWMRTQGWRRFGWYVWDKGDPVSGNWNGRLPYAHEWIFHFNKKARAPNKTIPCKWAGKHTFRRNKNGSIKFGAPSMSAGDLYSIADLKTNRSILALAPQRKSVGHPAVFPVALPTEIIRAYTDPGEVVFDPFGGSGTTILAAENEGRTCYAMEIEPSYCAIAIERWNKSQGVKNAI